MDLKKYQNDALRTESIIKTPKANYNTLISTLDLFIQTAKVLDALKRSIYYNNDERLNNLKVENLTYATESFITNMTCTREKEKLNVDPRALHGIIGICTEAGELAEALESTLSDDNELDSVNVHEEMHDISWYMAILHDSLGLDWGDGLQKNINKLRERFPEKFTEKNAINRNLKKERKSLGG